MNSDRITPDTSCSTSAKLAGIDVQKTWVTRPQLPNRQVFVCDVGEHETKVNLIMFDGMF